MSDKACEKLLNSWIRFNNTIKGNRFLSGTSLNEMVVLQIILRNENDCVTPSMLCKETKLLKSQLNAVLNSMQSEGLIKREIVESDRRKQRIAAEPKGRELYKKHHKSIMSIVKNITSELGKNEAEQLANLMNKVSDRAEYITEKKLMNNRVTPAC